MVKISTNTIITCGVDYLKSLRWTVSQLDSATFALIRTLDLSSNPSALTGELIFAENSLSYGLYEFKFATDLMFNSETLSSTIQTYVKIVPSGVAVFALENGVKETKIGSSQRYYLRPTVYSFDFDGLILPSQLDFVYYCRVIRLDSTYVNMEQTDLETYKLNGQLTMNRNETCFASNSN